MRTFVVSCERGDCRRVRERLEQEGIRTHQDENGNLQIQCTPDQATQISSLNEVLNVSQERKDHG